MFLNSLIRELCTKEENNKAGCTLNFGGQYIIQKDRPKETLENLSSQYQFRGSKGFIRHFNVKKLYPIFWFVQ